MSTPTTGWDETSPSGSDALNAGDNRIREMKTQIREVIDVDHKFASSGSDADNGCHDQVTLLEKADLGTGAVGKTILGSQTVSGKGELVYTDEDNNDIQITSGGKVHAPSLAGVYPAADLTALATIMGYVYPVGIVIETVVSTNPATLLGIGTWAAFGTGRVTIAINAADTDFDTVEETGGAKTTSISAHTHPITFGASGSSGVGTLEEGAGAPNRAEPSATDSGGSSTPSILPPYIVVYRWKRTA